MPSSWRPSPGSHLGRLHPASFVTRWLGTRGRMRNAPFHGEEARPAPRGASLAKGGSRGPTRSPCVGHPPQVSPARVADPAGSSAEPKTEPPHAPLSLPPTPVPRHSPPPRQLPAPLDPTRRRLPLPEAPRSRAPPPGARPRRALTTRGPAQRFLPLPRCHLLPRLLSSAVCARPSCSRICFWPPARNAQVHPRRAVRPRSILL